MKALKMIHVLIGILILLILVYLYRTQEHIVDTHNANVEQTNHWENLKEYDLKQYDHLSYAEALESTKEFYPFDKWRDNFFEFEMEQYTEENCSIAEKQFDDLLARLKQHGENTSAGSKEKLFQIAIEGLNRLSQKEEAIIETGEREELCELIDKITIAARLNPEDYAGGDGIADLWREW